jgi:hypothetical protein
MNKWTHIFHEAGNGFPQDGDDVLVAGRCCGNHKIMRVKDSSRIHTHQWRANWIYIQLEDSDSDYGDMTEEEQDEAWENMYHVDLCEDEDEDEDDQDGF